MAVATPDNATYSARNTPPTQFIPIDRIHRWEEQPRKHFAEDSLQELADSIMQHGLIEPIVVRDHPEQPGHFLLIAGERRWRASLLAGLQEIEAKLLADIDDAQAMRLALIENLQRQDLDPIEEAQGYRQLNRIVGLTQTEIAAAVNRSQPAIANAMRLLELPDEVLELIRTGQLWPAHGRALVKYAKWAPLCLAISTRAVEEDYTSKELEEGIPRPWGFANDGYLASIDYGIEVKDLKEAGITVFGKGGMGRFTPDVKEYKRFLAERAKRLNSERSRNLQRLRDQGTEPLLIERLGYSEYMRLDDSRVTAAGLQPGDPGTCQAVEKDGSLVWITTDVERVERAKKDADKAAAAEKRQRRKDLQTRTLDTLAEHEPGSRELALVITAAMQGVKPAIIMAAFQRYAPHVLGNITIHQYGTGHKEWAGHLSHVPLPGLLRIGAEIALMKEQEDAFSNYGDPRPNLTNWYLDGAPAAVHERLGVSAPRDHNDLHHLDQLEKLLEGQQVFYSLKDLLLKFPPETKAALVAAGKIPDERAGWPVVDGIPMRPDLYDKYQAAEADAAAFSLEEAI